MLSIGEIGSHLGGHAPTLFEQEAERRAAVAMVLRDDSGPVEVLLIERARHEADPWSGHMAFPGGRVDDIDRTSRDAAERETLEEVGVSLAGAAPLGRLDDMRGLPSTARQLVVSAFVYHVRDPDPLVTNHEVQEAFWFPLASLLDPALHIRHPVRRGSRADFPGILVGEPGRHVVWGLTYRFLQSFFEVVGRPLPQRHAP